MEPLDIGLKIPREPLTPRQHPQVPTPAQDDAMPDAASRTTIAEKNPHPVVKADNMQRSFQHRS